MAGADARRAPPLNGRANADDSAAFLPAKPLLDALHATDADGLPRHVPLHDAAERPVDISLCRDYEGHLLLAVTPRPDDSEPLRRLARQMAGETDTARLLEILCNAGAEQAAGSGAGVLKAVSNEGEVVAAIGGAMAALGRRFSLRGSLAREVFRTRDVVGIDDFSRSTRPLMRAVPELQIGPMLLAPLIAHDVVVGVIAVTRDVGAPPFAADESIRLRAVADHAALALWKAELLEAAQSADRAKSRFLATVSHELRTPLTALAGYEELLADQVLGPLSDNQRDVLERMRSVTQHLASVIEELLAFSNLDQGRETVRPTDFLAADLVRAAAAVVEPLARQKRLAFEYAVPPADAPIRMTSDIDKIRQILVALAGNAVKFTEHGAVRLELEQRDADVRFTVRDTGIGISPQDIERLFKPFAQLDTSLTRRHGGTGLGLYISRGLAALLGGRIEVASELGRGSAFTLVLPADEAP